MSDLISRQALCNDFREYKVHPVSVFSSDEFEVKGYNDGIDLAISVIAEFPSAEPERKKGKWEFPRKFGHAHLLGKCSVCGKYEGAEWIALDNPHFCPNCGADMRGE